MVSRLRAVRRVPAPLIFVAGGLSMYLGAAVAVVLFDRVEPAGVAWLRLVGAALVLLVWRRPGRAAWRGRRLGRSAAFGMVTALMNVAFYEAAARLPLGTTVAVEFLGPVLVAALGSRSRRDWLALALVVLGVALVADVRIEGSPSGVAFALAAAALWAGYVVLGTMVSRAGAGAGEGVDDLTAGFAVAAVVLCPLGLLVVPAVTSAGSVASLTTVVGAGMAVGVASSVVPYALDQVVLRRVGRARFAVLLALLPLTASVVGLVVLAQVPRPLEALGIASVVIGVALRRDVEGEAG